MEDCCFSDCKILNEDFPSTLITSLRDEILVAILNRKTPRAVGTQYEESEEQCESGGACLEIYERVQYMQPCSCGANTWKTVISEIVKS